MLSPADAIWLEILDGGVRCLVASKGFADGEVICCVPSGIFGDEEKLTQFLRLPGHDDFKDGVIKVSGVTLQLTCDCSDHGNSGQGQGNL